VESTVDPSATTEFRKTPLNAVHRRLGAKMVNFGGWDMPVEYPATGGLVAEHKAVRGGVGVFDVSHMGDIRISTGQERGGALAAVQHVSMNDASNLAIGQAQYSAMLYPAGTFVDDVIVHRLGEDDFLLVINAGTREKDINWVRENTKDFDCRVEELSDAYTQLAIQGPRAVDVMQELTDVNLGSIKNYWFTHGTVCGLKNILIARTGYTGEDGFEIYVPSDVAISEAVWTKVIEAGGEFGILPCGLGCRNTLRLEAKMALYGHEISEKINVWEAGLERYCKVEKGEFIGRAALQRAKEAGLSRTLVGLEMVERGIARDE
jgi:aminomethyltransferase